MAMRSSDKQATAELLATFVEVAIAHGRRHYSESGEPLATTMAVLECLQREGFVTVEEPGRRRSCRGRARAHGAGRTGNPRDGLMAMPRSGVVIEVGSLP
jgi:hypothetical protein